ncbi:MAG TPA: ATP-binding protein, partial [Puia sp.]|nr:ATP-binding protein [Puia sp.]
GLSVYDGSRFTNYTTENGLASSLINDIIELGIDSLLIVPNTNQLQYMVHGVVKNYQTIDHFVPVINQLIKCSDGFFYALADEGFYRFENNQFNKIGLSDNGKNITNLIHGVELHSRLYMITDPNLHTISPHGEVIVYDLSTGKSLISKNKEPTFFVGLTPDSNVLLSRLKGVFKMDAGSFETGTIRFSDAGAQYHIPANISFVYIFFDKDQSLWLLEYNGVLKIDKNGNTKFFNSQNGLPESQQGSLFQDKENIIWLTGAHTGITKIVNQDIEVFLELKKGFQSSSIYTDIHTDSLWLYDRAQNEILLHYHGADKIFTGTNASSFNSILCLNQSVYLAKWYEIFKVTFDNEKKQFAATLLYKDSTATNGFSYILPDEENNIICISDKLVVFLRNGKIISHALGYLADEAAISNNHLWTATRANKLFLFRLNPQSPDNYLQLLHVYDKVLQYAAPRSVTADKKNNVWIGTRDHGIFLFSFHDQALHFVKQFTTKDGLSENFISYLHSDPSGNIWACSPAGLDKIILINGKYYIENITGSGNAFQQIYKISTSKSNEHWVTAADGIIRVTNDFFPASNYTPALQFVQIKIGDSAVFDSRQTPELSYLQNNISFAVAAPTFCDEKQTRFSYLLQGSSKKKWSDPSTRSEINFVNLEPGNYTLSVKARFLNGLYPEQHADYSFIILPPWWQTWWFRISLLASIITIIIFAIMFYYDRKWEKQKIILEKEQLVEQERTRIATDMHDDLGAGLSRIKFLSETMDIKNRQQKSIGDDIIKIKGYSDEMITKMGEIVWALNEKNDSLKDLIAYSRAYAAEYLFQNEIKSQITIPEIIPDLFVSGEFRRNIYLTIKEALHNVVKHAHANEVSIDVQISQRLIIVLHDNGIGFDAEQIRPFSNGLTNMKKRISDIDGDLEIKRQQGTELKVSVPLPR